MAGTNLPGATNYFLSMNGILASQEGDYRVVVSNPYNSVTSAIAHVTVTVPPTITAQPRGTNVLAGRPFTLAVAATGSAPLSYSWTFEGTNHRGRPIFESYNLKRAGDQRRHLPRSRPEFRREGDQRRRAGPGFSGGPDHPVGSWLARRVRFVQCHVRCRRRSAASPCHISGISTASAIAGATGAQYAINNAQAAHTGNYQVFVTNGSGSAPSAVATLTVLPMSPYFVTTPVGGALPVGTNFSFSALGSRVGTNQLSVAAVRHQPAGSHVIVVDTLQPGGRRQRPLRGHCDTVRSAATSSPSANLVVTGVRRCLSRARLRRRRWSAPA